MDAGSTIQWDYRSEEDNKGGERSKDIFTREKQGERAKLC